MTRQVVRFTVVLTVVCCNIGFAWWPSSLGTHDRITQDAIEDHITAAEYPDLVRFSEQLRQGSATEAHAPPSVPGDVPEHPHRWFPTADHWWDYRTGGKFCALQRYERYEFEETYRTIGYMLHNLQDLCVPSHTRKCIHGTLSIWTDGLEARVIGNHDYAMSSTAWTFTDANGHTWYYWLDDPEDDDDEDPANSPDDGDSIVDHNGDFSSEWGLAESAFGTYGLGWEGYYDEYNYKWISTYYDPLPGLNQGRDGFHIHATMLIAHEQLQEALGVTISTMKAKSEALPPVIPNIYPYTLPYISADIFGPNQIVYIAFTGMENRKRTVRMLIAASGAPIKDITGKVWDRGPSATYYLDECSTTGQLPWMGPVIQVWNGQLGSGELPDGEHQVKLQIEDQDGHTSQERMLSVKYDKTPPTGFITIW